jgi:predicted regulator of Ras-like GTPase activity (Roadblock/LC7/MglB family)
MQPIIMANISDHAKERAARLLSDLVTEQSAIIRAVLASTDGLLIAHTNMAWPGETDAVANAQRAGADIAGLFSLSRAACHEFGVGNAMRNPVSVVWIELADFVLCTTPAGRGTVLTVLVADDVDMDVLNHAIKHFIQRIEEVWESPGRNEVGIADADPSRP